ncbi:MAG: hypothetical protein WC722_18380 [Rhodospirillales bacterium]|jgi:hypothetical protein
MSKLLIIAGIIILGSSGLSALIAIAVGTAQWLSLLEPLSQRIPPQSLVVGGLFLGVPVMAIGWALIWFGGWARNHR